MIIPNIWNNKSHVPVTTNQKKNGKVDVLPPQRGTSGLSPVLQSIERRRAGHPYAGPLCKADAILATFDFGAQPLTNSWLWG